MVSWTRGQQKDVCIFIIFITSYLVCAPPLFLTHFFSDFNEICKATTHSHLLIYSLHTNHLWLFIGLKLKILSKHFRDYTSQMCSLCCLRDLFFFLKHMASLYYYTSFVFSCELFQSFQNHIFFVLVIVFQVSFAAPSIFLLLQHPRVALLVQVGGRVWLELIVSSSPHSGFSKLLRRKSFIFLSSELNQK